MRWKTLCVGLAAAAATATASAQETPIGERSERETCFSVPGWLANAAVGDVLLKDNRGGVIGQLLASLGQNHSHSMVLTSHAQATGEYTTTWQTYRHNTLSEGAVQPDDGGLVPDYLVPETLRDGLPGTISQAPTGTEAGLVLSGDAATLADRTNGVAWINAMAGYYRLYAFTNITWNDPFMARPADGNMCSGTIYWAHRWAKNNGGWGLVHYPEEVRTPAAVTLHSIMADKIRRKEEGLNWLEDIGAAIGGFLEGDSVDEFTEHASNQLVNCMAYDDCGNTSRRWQTEGVGPGSSLSPDDLLLKVGVEEGFPFTTASPIVGVPESWYCVWN